MKHKPKNHCPYREGTKCTHKDREFNKKGNKRKCGFPKSPESCDMYLDWVDMIDMDYLEKRTISTPTNPPKNNKGDNTND